MIVGKGKEPFLAVDQAFRGASFFIPFSFKMAGDESGTTLGQPHLARQDLSSLVSVSLTAFTALCFNVCGCRSRRDAKTVTQKVDIVTANGRRCCAATTRHMTAGLAGRRANTHALLLQQGYIRFYQYVKMRQKYECKICIYSAVIVAVCAIRQ